jgi:hypothetical protein
LRGIPTVYQAAGLVKSQAIALINASMRNQGKRYFSDN